MVNPLAAAWMPAPDPLPPAGPGWAFTFLLLAAFSAHLMLVNAVFGGVMIAAAHGIAGRGTPEERRRLVTLLAVPVAWATALLVLFGVAALLFLQSLYGPVFYTASVILGRAWLAFPGLALAGCAGVFAARRTRPGAASAARPCRLLPWMGAVLAFLAVLCIQVTMHVAQIRPDLWVRLLRFPFAAVNEPTWIWRVLYFAAGAVGFAGVFVAVTAVAAQRRGGDTEACRWAGRIGARWAAAGVGLQLGFGAMLMLRMPRPALSAVLDPRLPHVIPFVGGIGAGLALLVVLAQLREPSRQPALLASCALLAVVTQVLMVMTRHGIRTALLAPHSDALRLSEASSRLGFPAFVAMAAAAFVVVGFLAGRAVRDARGSTAVPA